MAGNIFIDTNILVYANNSLSPVCAAAQTKLQEAVNTYERLWVSRQVFREFAAVVSREMLAAGNPDFIKLESIIQQFERDFSVAEDASLVTYKWLTLLRETKSAGKQVHDANIVATMLTHGIESAARDWETGMVFAVVGGPANNIHPGRLYLEILIPVCRWRGRQQRQKDPIMLKKGDWKQVKIKIQKDLQDFWHG